ncbi:hypothetical protein FRC17_003764 [Serendipita sp. 399]|nr:hypothetical protein FRC17_003764 [Serendipita sp. 399]
MSYPTFPAAQLASENSENSYYIRNEVIKRWENNPTTQRTLAGPDYVLPVANPKAIVVDIAELFSSINISKEGLILNKQIALTYDSFGARIKQLHGVIDTIGEAHRTAASNLRQITDYYGSRRGMPAGEDIRNAIKSLRAAEKSLADVSSLIIKDAQTLEGLSTQRRPPLKVAAANFANYAVGEYLSFGGAVVGTTSQAFAVYTQAHPRTGQSINVTGLTASAFGISGAFLTLFAAVRFFCPDAKAYTSEAWMKTQAAVTTITSQIDRLMDLLGGLDLCWGKMRRHELKNVDVDDITDLRRIIDVLDHHVDQCRVLGNAISTAAKIQVPPKEITHWDLEYERQPALPPIPDSPGDNIPTQDNELTIATSRRSTHTYPPASLNN